MSFLVIGARGFIGTALVSELRRHGQKVTCVTRGSLAAETDPNITWRRVDHMSQQSWDDIIAERFETIYHLGWSTIPRTAENDPVSDLVENVGTGLRLLIAVKALSPLSRVIFASSGGTIYGRAQCDAMDETHSLRPISAYGVGKLAYEQYLALYRSEHGIDAICARMSNPYGRDQHTNREFGAVSTFIRMAVNGQPIKIFGSGEITRDYLHISDLTRALYGLAMVPELPACINIGSGEGSRLLDIIDILGELLGRPVEYEIIEGRSFDVPRLVLDNSLLRRTIEWRPAVTLRGGIERILASMDAGKLKLSSPVAGAI